MTRGREIRSYDYVNHAYDKVRETLASNAEEVFRNATNAATNRAEAVAAQLHVNLGALEVGTEIEINVDRIEESERGVKKPATTRLHLSWEAARSPRLFPLMEAELAVYPLTARETQLDFHGRYQPPMGPLGGAIDSVVGHRIAEASVHRFVSEVAAYLRETLG